MFNTFGDESSQGEDIAKPASEEVKNFRRGGTKNVAGQKYEPHSWHMIQTTGHK